MPRTLLAALLLLAAAPASAAEAAVTTELPPGPSKSIRMRGLPAGTVIAVRIVTSGRLLVALVGMKQLKEPKPGSKPVFRGVVQNKLSFRVTVSEADDYLLVLNNRAGKETLSVETEIRTARRAPKPPPNYSPRPEKASISPSTLFVLHQAAFAGRNSFRRLPPWRTISC